MNPMINLTVNVERELELERQGLRRTRRHIGDDSRVVDASWYQSKASPSTENRPDPGIGFRNLQSKARRERGSSILGRLLHLRPARRQPASSES